MRLQAEILGILGFSQDPLFTQKAPLLRDEGRQSDGVVVAGQVGPEEMDTFRGPERHLLPQRNRPVVVVDLISPQWSRDQEHTVADDVGCKAAALVHNSNVAVCGPDQSLVADDLGDRLCGSRLASIHICDG